MGGTVGYPKRFWTDADAQNALISLRDSELSQTAKLVEETHDEYLTLTEQIEALERKRSEVVETGKKAVRVYRVARYNLFLKKVREEGKVYCDYKDHVTKEVSIHLMWRKDVSGYYIHHVCEKCLKEIRTDRTSCAELLEMKEEKSIIFQLKAGEWVPLNPDRTHDHRDENMTGWIHPDLARKYDLPISFDLGHFPPDLDMLFR